MTSFRMAALIMFVALVPAPGCDEDNTPVDINAPVNLSMSCAEKSLEIIDIACFPQEGRVPWAIREATGKTRINAFTVTIEAENGSWSFNGWERQEYSVAGAVPPVKIMMRAAQGLLDDDENATLDWLCTNHSCCAQCCENQDAQTWFDTYWAAASVRVNAKPWRTDTLNLALEQEIALIYP